METSKKPCSAGKAVRLNQSVVLLIMCACIFLTARHASAGALWMYEGSIPDMGMANAGRAASALDASTAFGNPAGMTVLDRSQLVTGLLGIRPVCKFDNDHSSYPGGNGGDAGYWTPAATFAYVYKLNDRLRLGLYVGSYLGLGLDYGNTWSGRYYCQRGELLTADVNPSLGIRITDWLSFGAGFDLVGGKFKSRAAVNTLVRQADGYLKYNDSDIGYGYNLGMLIELSKQTRFGLTYRSAIDLNFNDRPTLKREGWLLDALLNLRNQAKRTLAIDMTLPQEIMFSGWHQLTPRLALCANFGWQDWSKFGQPDVSISGNATHAFTVNLKYHDTYHVAFGGQYRLAPKWLMSAGVAYDTSPIKHASDRSPAAPLDRQIRYGVGLQYDINDDITIGTAYEIIDAGLCRVDQKSGPFRGDIKGKYNTNFINALNMNIVWKF